MKKKKVYCEGCIFLRKNKLVENDYGCIHSKNGDEYDTPLRLEKLPRRIGLCNKNNDCTLKKENKS